MITPEARLVILVQQMEHPSLAPLTRAGLLLAVVFALWSAVPAAADDPEWLLLYEQGFKSYQRRNFAQAKKMYEAAHRLVKDKPDGALEDATTLSSLGHVYKDEQRYEEAALLYKKALSLRESRLGREHGAVLEVVEQLLQCYHALGQQGQIAELLKRWPSARKTYPEIKKAYRTWRKNTEWQRYCELGCRAGDHGDYAQATRMFQRALAEVSGLKDSRLARAEIFFQQGSFLLKEGKPSQAESLSHQAASYRAAVLGKRDTQTLRAELQLYECYVAQSKHAEAQELWRHLLKEAAAGRHLDLVTEMGHSCFKREDWEEAARLYARALAIKEQTVGLSDPSLLPCLDSLSDCYRYQGKFGKAASYLRRAVLIRERTLGPTAPGLIVSLHKLGLAYYFQNEYSAAEPIYRRLRTHYQRNPGDPDAMARILNEYAIILEKTGKFQEAQKLREQALSIVRNHHKLD